MGAVPPEKEKQQQTGRSGWRCVQAGAVPSLRGKADGGPSKDYAWVWFSGAGSLRYCFFSAGAVFLLTQHGENTYRIEDFDMESVFF